MVTDKIPVSYTTRMEALVPQKAHREPGPSGPMVLDKHKVLEWHCSREITVKGSRPL